MILPEAKKLLNAELCHPPALSDHHLRNAFKLAVEAINYIERLRAFSSEHRANRLPGEDGFNPIHPTPDDKKRLRESPLAQQRPL